MIGLEFLLGVMQTGSPVAHLAHVGGMLFGYALLKYWKLKRKIHY
jgi:membrane associated rhomboid family serine protease